MARRTWDESDVRVRANKRGSRPRTKQRPSHEDAVVARVVAVDRGRYTCVVDEDGPEPVTVLCVRAKELRRRPIVPGDLVGVVGDVSGAPDTLARIVRIAPRRTVLRRTARRIIRREPCCNGNVETLARACSRDSIVAWHFRSWARKRATMRRWAAAADGPPVLLLRRPAQADALLASLKQGSGQPPT